MGAFLSPGDTVCPPLPSLAIILAPTLLSLASGQRTLLCDTQWGEPRREGRPCGQYILVV